MAAFVDDVRSSFDASDFCAVVSAGVGHGKTTSSLALRDSSAVSAASAALQFFRQHATSPEPPDVVAAYVQYSPGANELFTALRAVSTNSQLVSLAIDCLTAIVRYSLDNKNTLNALEGARSVVKEVVKTRAVLVREVFLHDHRGCAKKALNLLRLVAQCHPILAKELVNRFNLTAEPMAPTLCSKENNFCRVPFLDLIFVLLASGDYDVANSLATTARSVLITCLRVIAERTVEEANPTKSSVLSAKEKAKKKPKPATNIPLYLQKIELIAAINLLLAIERHLLTLPQIAVKRAAFAYPVLVLLASIAAADIPPLHVAPREVLPEHEALRKTASRLFVSIAADFKVSKMAEVVAALTQASVDEGTGAVDFVVRVVEGQPRVAKGLLEKGTYLSEQPRLSSSWFGAAAVISACVLRLPCAISKFADKSFFAKCLSHEDSLIRHTGITIMHAFSKVVQADKAAVGEPEKFLPPLDYVQKHLKMYDASYVGAQKLLVAYQKLFCDDVEGKKADPIKLAMELAGQDLVLSEDSIRAALVTTPRDALSSILRKGYLAKLIVHAAGTADKATAKRLWYLSRDILSLTGLFPNDTATEIDIYLSLLSAVKGYLPECANALEKIVFMAWDMPYRLFDEIHKETRDATECLHRISLLSVATVYRLRKMKQLSGDAKAGKVDAQLQAVLQDILTTIISCQSLSGSECDRSFLKDALQSIAPSPDREEMRLSASLSNEQRVLMDCRIVQSLFVRASNYPLTPYLKLIQEILLFHLHMQGAGITNAFSKSTVADGGLIWHAWRTFREAGNRTDAYNPFGIALQSAKANTVVAALDLGGLLDDLLEMKSEPQVLRHVLRLRKSLSATDFMLWIAIALRVAQGHMVRSFIMKTAIEMLSCLLDVDEEVTSLTSFLQESVLSAVSCSQSWNEGEIHGFVLLSRHILNTWRQLTAKESHISFSLALLARLVVHDDAGTCILSCTFLSNDSKVDIPPLSSLSFSSTTDLSVLLTHSTDFRKSVIARVSDCSVSEISPTLRNVLPLLQAVMRPQLYSDLKKAVGYEHEEVCRTILEAVVTSKEPICDRSSGMSVQMREAARQIGDVLAFSWLKFDDLLAALSYARTGNNKAALGNFCLLLEKTFAQDKARELELCERISDVQVIECLTTLTEWLAQNRLNLDDITHQAVLTFFHGVLKHLRARNVATYSVVKDVASLEKILTAACSNIMKSLHKSLGCCPKVVDEPAASDTISAPPGFVRLPLLCVSEVLGLDLLLDKVAKRSIISLSEHDGDFLVSFLQRGQRASTSHLSVPNEAADTVVTFLNSALMRLPRFGLEEEVARSLSIAEGVFSEEKSTFNASLSLSDTAVRKCMERIAGCLKLNDSRKKFCLQDRRTGLFAAISSQVMLLFEKKRLEYTCREMLGFPVNHDCEELSPAITGSDGIMRVIREDALDPVFVLRVFLYTCTEALNAPGTAVIDIGRVAKDGLLGVVLTGIACDDEEIRTLSYACLQRFSEVVGPVSGVPLGSAAALYRDRKQLAFLLELLQHSLHAPMTRVLPLFAVWFRTAVKIALSPTHDANKAVTFFFLRSPLMDVSDCFGLSYLLRCDSSRSEMKATRLIALDIIKYGVRSMKDVAVLRKRKVLDALLQLGGSASGYEQHVRDEVLNTLAILVRYAGFPVAHELVFSYGVVPWLLRDAGQVEEPDHVLRRRLDVLSHIATSFSQHDERERAAGIFSEALSVLTRTFLRGAESLGSGNVLSIIIKCSAAVARLTPQRCRLIHIDFSQIYLKYRHLVDLEALDVNLVASVIARQKNVDVQPEIYSLLLETAESEVVKTGSECTSDAVLALPNALNICMLHAFIAQSLLQGRGLSSVKEKLTSGFCLRLAFALYTCPTVWLTVASVCTLDQKGVLSSDLEAEADQLPAHPPEIMDPERDQIYCTVVDRIRKRVIDKLISCSSLVSDDMGQHYISANGIR